MTTHVCCCLSCAVCVCVCADLMNSLSLLPSTTASLVSNLVYDRREGSFTDGHTMSHKEENTQCEKDERRKNEQQTSLCSVVCVCILTE